QKIIVGILPIIIHYSDTPDSTVISSSFYTGALIINPDVHQAAVIHLTQMLSVHFPAAEYPSDKKCLALRSKNPPTDRVCVPRNHAPHYRTSVLACPAAEVRSSTDRPVAPAVAVLEYESVPSESGDCLAWPEQAVARR